MSAIRPGRTIVTLAGRSGQWLVIGIATDGKSTDGPRWYGGPSARGRTRDGRTVGYHLQNLDTGELLSVPRREMTVAA